MLIIQHSLVSSLSHTHLPTLSYAPCVNSVQTLSPIDILSCYLSLSHRSFTDLPLSIARCSIPIVISHSPAILHFVFLLPAFLPLSSTNPTQRYYTTASTPTTTTAAANTLPVVAHPLIEFMAATQAHGLTATVAGEGREMHASIEITFYYFFSFVETSSVNDPLNSLGGAIVEPS